jgi:hypothetical protein
MKMNILFRILVVLLLLILPFSIPAQAQGQTEAAAFTELRDFNFDFPTQGWILLDEHLFRTVDGGGTWDEVTPTAEHIGAVTFRGTDGWVVLTEALEGGVAYSLARTRDAGRTWQTQPVTLFAAEDAWILPKSIRIQFDDSQHGTIHIQHATSANFNIQSAFVTGDGGLTWKQTESAVEMPPEGQPEEADILQRNMLTDSLGWTKSQYGNCSFSDAVTKAGADCTQETRLVKTTDGGESWQTVPLPHTTNGILERHVTQSETNIPQPGLAYTQTWVGQGVDICEIPNLGKLQTWWSNSPYTAVNLYIGGDARACDNVNLSKSFLVQLNQQGWKFIPTWVGPQAACTGYSVRMSGDPATAYLQGKSEANDALVVAAQLGLTEVDQTGTVIYYDLEAYDTSNTACKNAALAFIQGWTEQMESAGDVSALYGASCASALSDVGDLANPPDAIWVANWYFNYEYNPTATVWDTACLNNSYWASHQRIRQYTGGHTETWGGIAISVDSNVLDGVVAVPAQGLVSDAFTNASVISSTPYVDAQIVGAATSEANDPILPCSVGQGHNSVWYRFTPTSSERMLIRTLGSTYDTVLGVWTGSAGSLTNQACNDNFNGQQAEVQVDVVAGTTYFIEAASPSVVGAGTLVISVFQPAQDDFNGAKILAPKPSTASLNTTTTGVSNDDPAAPACILAPGSNSVWYKFTPTAGGPVSLDTFSSNYDTYIAVWSGARGSLSAVACNDDTAGGQQSQVDLTLTSGVTYYIEVAQYNGTVAATPQAVGGGTLRLHLTSFHDVPGTHWAWTWIETLAANAITGGCGTAPMSYCPNNGVTRAEMAVFLERGMKGPTFTPPEATGAIFLDIPAGHWAGGWIEQLAADGVTGGCGNGNYCPDQIVTRAQMAVFLLRAKHGPDYLPPEVGDDTGFTDVAVDYWAAAWIKQLAAEGITGGCDADNYCPEEPVTRAQMAVFLTSAFGLTMP